MQRLASEGVRAPSLESWLEPTRPGGITTGVGAGISTSPDSGLYEIRKEMDVKIAGLEKRLAAMERRLACEK